MDESWFLVSGQAAEENIGLPEASRGLQRCFKIFFK